MPDRNRSRGRGRGSGRTRRQNAHESVPESPSSLTLQGATLLGSLLSDQMGIEDNLKYDNWGTWKPRILHLLDLCNLKKFPLALIKEPRERDSEEYAVWRESDQLAALLILNNISPGRSMAIFGTHEPEGMTSAQIWEILCEKHQIQNSRAVVARQRKFFATTAEEGDDIMAHLHDVQTQRVELSDFGFVLEDKIFNPMLIASLPESWSVHGSFILSVHGRDVPTDTLISELELNHRRVSEDAKISSCTICLKTNHTTDDCHWKQKGGYCTHCRFGGHWTNECRNEDKGKRKQRQNRAQGVSTSASQAEDAHMDVDESDENTKHPNSERALSNGIDYPWVASTTASSHVAKDRSMFSTYTKETKVLRDIAGNRVLAIGRGSVILSFKVEDQTHKFRLLDTLHIPTISDNIFCVERFLKTGGSFQTGDGRASLVNQDGTLIAVGQRINGLFYMDAHAEIDFSLAAKPTWDEWHRRFGHIAVSDLQVLHRKGLVDGFVVDEKSEIKDCETCVRIKRKPLQLPPPKECTATYPGELIHTDVWGPASEIGTDGARFYLIIVDDYSRHWTIRLMKYKDDAGERLKEYIAYVERQLGKVVKNIHADNGKDYLDDNFKRWCLGQGLVLKRGAPTSDWKGVAERCKIISSLFIDIMLEAKELPKELWGVAAVHAAYVRNRTYTRTIGDITPLEKWSGERPNVEEFREFGDPIAISNGPVESRCESHIFVGFSNVTPNVVYVRYDDKPVVYYFDVKRKQVEVAGDYRFLSSSAALKNRSLYLME